MTIPTREIIQIMKCLFLSLRDLFTYDNEFVNRSIKEESINHRLAVYLEKNKIKFPLIKDYNVDVEYDKMADNTSEENALLIEKFGVYQKGNKKIIRPDIIIHKRYTNQSNLLFLECKKSYLNKNDRNKLQSVKRFPLNYALTFGIEYHPGKEYYRIYEQINDEYKIKKYKK